MHVERLLKLADHLDGDKLIHEKFNFNYFNKGGSPQKACGTSGCALGECPGLFDGWAFKGRKADFESETMYDTVSYVDYGEEYLNFDAAKYFFGLTEDEATLLFLAGEHHLGSDYKMDGDTKVWDFRTYQVGTDHKYMTPLNMYCTAKDVAAHIREFVKLKTGGTAVTEQN